jgi:HAMP domain-containing protein
MAFLSVTATRSGQSAVEKSELSAVEGQAVVSSSAVQQYLLGVIGRADQLGTTSEVVAFVRNAGAGPTPPLEATDSQFDVEGVLLTDMTGTVLAGSPASTRGTSMAGTDWFVASVAGQQQVGRVTYDATRQRSSVTVSAPVREPGAAVVGVAALQVSGFDILYALNQAPLGPGGQAVLVDRDGVIVLARDNRLPGKSLADLGLAALAAEIAEAPMGTLARAELPGRGTQVVAWSETTGGNIAVVFQPRAVFLAPINRLAATTRIALGVVAFVALALALLVARRLSRPVLALTNAAAAIESEGEPDTERLEAIGRSKDDIGRLARVFSSMAVQVADRERRLREQVAALRVEIDEDRRRETVSNLTDSEFFRELEARARELRRAMKEHD